MINSNKWLTAFILFNSVIIFPAQIGFQSIVGEIPKEIKEIADSLKSTPVKTNIKYPKGILLVGPSGIGKTALAKALSKEVKCTFIYKNAAELDADGIKALYKNARTYANKSPYKKSIIFIDDFHIFSLANPTRNGDTRTNVLALMNEMDGFDKDDLIITIGSTHSISNFDPSLVRPGRFEKIIELSYPNPEKRKLMIQKFNEGNTTKIYSKLDFNKITAVTYNFSPADIKQLVTNALKIAQQKNSMFITENHFFEGVIEILKTKLKFNTEKNLNLNIRIQTLNELLNSQKEKKIGYARLVGSVPNEIKDLVQQIKDDTRFRKFNLELPKGILLTGPAGSGKTSLVRAISEEANCEFIAVSGAEFVDQFVGSGAQKIRDLFKEAKQKAINSASGKTIIFIDELDSIGKRTGTTLDSTVTELLTQMDGFENDTSIIVIAATNFPENIDVALLRPGRFSKIIKIGLPDLAKRKLILIHYTKSIPLSKTVNIEKIALATNNFSPADLKELIQKTSSLALEQSSTDIQEKHFIQGIKQILTERIIKGEKNVQQQIDALDVIFNGKEATKGFKNIAGGVEPEIEDLLKMIKGELDYKAFGIPFPKGVLLAGPPGTGKTALVRALAQEVGCEFIQAKGSDFIEKYVGVGAQRIRELFTEARNKSQASRFEKTIIFIDELDAIGSRTSSDNSETQRTITELLTQMDGFYKDESVIIIGATNMPSALDPALLRAGRFDTIVEIPLPNLEKRKALFEFYTKNKPTDKTISFDDFAKKMEGCNAADIKNLVDKAAKIAMKANEKLITKEHFDKAIAIIKTAENKKQQNYI